VFLGGSVRGPPAWRRGVDEEEVRTTIIAAAATALSFSFAFTEETARTAE
jgi:hypothetical protein